MKNLKRILLSTLLYTALIGLLWWALRSVPLTDIWVVLKQLRFWQIGILLALNVLVILAMTARWWLIVRAEKPNAPFWLLVGYRLSAFGLSYFTPGPQVGGEPWQVIALQKNHAISYARATAAVIMDKLIEFLVNFLLLAVGAWAILRVELIPYNGSNPLVSLIVPGVVLIWPLVHIVLMYHHILPLSLVLRALPFPLKRSRPMRLLFASERLAANFCQRHLGALLGAAGVSLLAVLGIVVEYALMVSFLGMRLTAWQTLAALTALQLAFLMPLPGGLGAMEASQVFALGFFGQPASAAIGLTLLQRARDLLNGGLGLLLAGRGFAGRPLQMLQGRGEE
ncbi:MAG: hypothetical protein Fur0043_03090 [Anaerolineales bacterium]